MLGNFFVIESDLRTASLVMCEEYPLDQLLVAIASHQRFLGPQDDDFLAKLLARCRGKSSSEEIYPDNFVAQ